MQKTDSNIQPDKPCNEQDLSLEIDANTASDAANKIAESLVFAADARRASPKPDFGDVVELVSMLKAIIFPAYCAVEHSRETVTDRLQSEISTAGRSLATIVRRCVLHDAESCDAMRQQGRGDFNEVHDFSGTDDELESFAVNVAKEFLQTLPSIRQSLIKDVQAAYDGDPACRSFNEVVLCYPGLSAVTTYRMAHELYLLNVPFLPRMMSEWAHSETGIDIHPGARIGDFFFIDHGTGVVIGETCDIGKNVKIYQGVTLGALSFARDERGSLVRGRIKRHPTIEDNVIIYANATVLGGRTIVGAGSVIGSSVWITRSVNPLTTVTMKTPRLQIRSKEADVREGLVDYQI